MPRGGSNRTSPQRKKLAGTMRRDRRPVLRLVDARDAKPSKNGGPPRPPIWLRPVAKAKWAELAQRLTERGILTELSNDLLANACMHWEMMVRCYHRVSKDGAVVKNRYGRWVKHPVLQVLRENSAAFRDCLSRMGMTPVDAGKVDAEEPDDGADEFFGAASALHR